MAPNKRKPSRKPAPKPTSNGSFTWLLIVLAVGFVGWQLVNKQPAPQPNNDQVVIDDSKPKPDDKKVSPFEKVQGVFIFVHDRSPMSPSDLLLITEVDKLCQSQPGLEYRSLDMELDNSEPVEKIKEYASSKGVKPPFVLFKATDSDKRTVVPMQSGMTIEDVKKVATK